MELINIEYNIFPCKIHFCLVNEKQALISDFGLLVDTDPNSVRPYVCSDYRFIPTRLRGGVLEKYGLTLSEYNMICDELIDRLDFGACKRCVDYPELWGA